MKTIVLRFTTNGTFNVTPGARNGKIRGCGGGGGGGGGGGASSSWGGGGGGGGASVWSEISFTPDPTKTYNVTIGAGGTAGIAGTKTPLTAGGNGGNGGDSIVDDGTNTIALFGGASGGAGGGADNATSGYGGMPFIIRYSSPLTTATAVDSTQALVTASGGRGGPTSGFGFNGNNNTLSRGGNSITLPWFAGQGGSDLGGDVGGGSGGGGGQGVLGNGANGGVGASSIDGTDPTVGSSAANNSGAGGGGGGGADSSLPSHPDGTAGGAGGSGYIEVEIEI